MQSQDGVQRSVEDETPPRVLEGYALREGHVPRILEFKMPVRARSQEKEVVERSEWDEFSSD